tara:strand:- start:1 stop:138 length:138 start_codon:yes stop_codon:yes gene_type:complete
VSAAEADSVLLLGHISDTHAISFIVVDTSLDTSKRIGGCHADIER